MVYEPLHHKYRPQKFAHVVGQSAVVKTLANAIRLQRIAPAYLFCGPRGTGKTSSARILAKSLNCIHGPTSDPCNICEQCRSITVGNALDVIEIDAASNTGVDNIRELIERAQFAPVSSRYKVYVLDEVHMLSSAAFNALLKTLEEPPAHVVFVLATTDPQRVLPTVISRCQRFDFRRIPLSDMVDHLTMIAEKEGIQISPTAVELIAQLSQGGLRDAESLLDQLSLFEGGVTVDHVWDLVGAVPERSLVELLQTAIRSGNAEQVLTQTRHLLDHGKEPLAVLQNLVGFCRDLLLAKTVPQRRDLVALTKETWDHLCQLALQFQSEEILGLQRRLRDAEPQLRHTTQPRLWLEVTLLDLLRPLDSVVVVKPDPVPQKVTVPATPSPPPEISKPPESAPPVHKPVERLPPEPLKPPESPPIPVSPSPDPAPIKSAKLSAQWDEFLGRLPPNAKGRLKLGHILQETEEEITLGFPSLGFAELAQQKIKEIRATSDALLGRSLKFKFVVAHSTESTPEIPPAEPVLRREPDPIPKPDPRHSPPPQSKSDPPPQTPQTFPAQRTASPAWEDLDHAARYLANHFSGRVAALDKEEYPDFLKKNITAAVTSLSTPHQSPSPELPEEEEEEIPF